MQSLALVNLEPLGRFAALGLIVALGPLAWVWVRTRAQGACARLQALTLLTLFLTFDLVLFGAFTRLTDSGLGCPDWPGCYGSASPLGASQHIDAAQSALPSGPVTLAKAWIEMLHRYLATAVGLLIAVIALARWRLWRRAESDGASLGWAQATFVWVCIQGAFGALTVTLKLSPWVVTLHLLGGLGLLALLALQVDAPRRRSVPVGVASRRGLWAVAALGVAQIALGGWVSANYAVLACSDFPTCQGEWWPDAMDFEQGFALVRPLGVGADGLWLPFEALTAIHWAHRAGAAVLLPAMLLLAWHLARVKALRAPAWGLCAVAAWQTVTGVANVVFDWPLAAAVSHTGGAAALVLLLALLLGRTHALALQARAGTAARLQGIS